MHVQRAVYFLLWVTDTYWKAHQRVKFGRRRKVHKKWIFNKEKTYEKLACYQFISKLTYLPKSVKTWKMSSNCAVLQPDFPLQRRKDLWWGVSSIRIPTFEILWNQLRPVSIQWPQN